MLQGSLFTIVLFNKTRAIKDFMGPTDWLIGCRYKEKGLLQVLCIKVELDLQSFLL